MKFALTVSTLLAFSVFAGSVPVPDEGMVNVVVDGVLKAVVPDALDIDYNTAELGTESKTLTVSVPTEMMSYEALRAMADAEVRVKGIMWPHTHRLHYKHNLLLAQAPFTVLRRPPDPFSVPYFNIDENTHHRRRISGKVIATRAGRVFIKPGTRHIVEINPVDGTELPSPGATVTAAGFATGATRRMIFGCSVLRVDMPPSPQNIPEPIDIDGEGLFSSPNGADKVDYRLNGKIVRIKGTAVTGYSKDEDSVFIRSGKRSLRVDMNIPGGRIGDIQAGSVLEVTGMCLHEFEERPRGTLIPGFLGIAILPRTAGDVGITAVPSWWTPMRLVYVIALLGLFTAAVLAHNRILKSLAVRKGRELYTEQIDHAKAELKVEERTRLAVEIHDSMSQILTGAALQIDAAMRAGDKGFDAAKGYLHNATRMLASCRHELRCCLWDLRSRTFEEKNMTEAVERTVAQHLGGAKASVRFNVPREELSDSDMHAVLRIIRELTVNSVRHGRASHVRIAGELRDGVIGFSVKDDGCGFDPDNAKGPAQGHFGIEGIRERIAALNGSVTVESAPGKGTKTTVSIPSDTGEK